jgi:hypothetical protein
MGTIFKGQELFILEEVAIDCPETSVKNSQYSLHNNPEDRSSQETI